MKDETLIWLSYADENLDVAGLTLEHGHLNACLQKENRVGDRLAGCGITGTSNRKSLYWFVLAAKYGIVDARINVLRRSLTWGSRRW